MFYTQNPVCARLVVGAGGHVRFFVEHHEAQQVSEVCGPEGLPLEEDLV